MCWTNKTCYTFRFKAGFSFRPLRGEKSKKRKKEKRVTDPGHNENQR